MKETKAYILSSFTSQPVEDHIKNEFYKRSKRINMVFGPYFQILQELNDESSPVYNSDYDTMILWMRFSDFFEASINKGEIVVDNLINEWEEYINLIIQASGKVHKRIIAILPAVMMTMPLGKGDVNAYNSITYLQEKARCLTITKLAKYTDIIVCDEELFFSSIGKKDALSPTLYALAKIPYVDNVFEAAGKCLADVMFLNEQEANVCIDLAMLLDEDYMSHYPANGIRLDFTITSDDYMHDIQNRIQMLSNWGKRIRLCTALSKDEFQKISSREDVFINRKCMDRAITDVSSMREAVEKIENKDSKVICITPNENLTVPNAQMLYIPENVQDWVGYVLETGLLDTIPINVENDYNNDNIKYNNKQESFFDSLCVSVRTKELSLDQMDEIMHLVENSRDFRFSQSIYTQNDVISAFEKNDLNIYGAYIDDRFGNYGLAALAILERNDNKIVIVDLMLSCRVLGKNVEIIFLKEIVNRVKKDACEEIAIIYRNNGRNEIAKRFLSDIFDHEIDQDSTLSISVEAILGKLAIGENTQNNDRIAENKKNCTYAYLRKRWAEYPEEIKRKLNAISCFDGTAEDIAYMVNNDVRSEWSSTCEYVAPRNEIESAMVDLWKEILHLDRVGVLDNFFALGGTSILATQLIVKFRDKFGINLPIRLFFDKSNIKQMAEYIEANNNDADMDKFSENSIFDYRYTMKTFLINEITLDGSIRIENGSTAIPVSKCKVAFLTGATGFLGAFLLQELLDRTTMKIMCLVRAENEASGKERIINNLKRYLIWKEEYTDRIEAICGDLEKPFLGMSEKKFDELCNMIDVIYHNGANTNFLNPYSMLKAANVGGTEEILRMAVRNKLKNVEYVSTHYVFSTISNEANKLIMEDQYPDENEIDIMGYQQTKLICEQMIRIARERGIPVSIYRVGRISGSSKTGACQTADFVWLMTKCCVESGIMFSENTRLELIPVDYVASAIVVASLNSEAVGRNFHIINEGRTPIQYITSWMDERGFKVKAYPYKKWKEMMTDIVSKNDSLKSIQTMLPFITEDTVELDKELRLDTKNIDEVLEGTGVKRIKVDKNLFKKYLDYFISIGFFHIPKTITEGE